MLKKLKNHDKDHTFLFGIHPILSVLKNKSRNCFNLYVTPNNKTIFSDYTKLHPKLKIIEVSREKLDSFFKTQTIHQGCILEVSRFKFLNFYSFFEKKQTSPLSIIILDQVTDPHNIGAIIRSAVAFNFNGILIPERYTPSFMDGIIAKSASGALEMIPLIQINNISQTIKKLKEYNFWCIGLDEGASTTIKKINLTDNIAIILGSEGTGLRKLTKDSCDILVKITTNPQFPSLNVSNAAAIALHELSNKQVSTSK